MKIYDITEFGAKGDGKTDNAESIQKAIDTCSLHGGGIVKVPGNNIFLTGPFFLKSYIELHIESNARILASPDESVYSRSAFPGNSLEGTIWIGCDNATNVAISGKGTIDGNGVAFMGEETDAAFILKPFTEKDPRPHVFTPVNVTGLTIKDVTFTNAAYWCIHLAGCNDVHITGIRIKNNLKIRNSDGIDIDHSRNVRISDCFIESCDDSICFKTRREYSDYGPTENVTVSNCILRSSSCTIKLGSENVDAIRNVIISDCIIHCSNRAIGIQNRDEGIVENIQFNNIISESKFFDDVMWGKSEPIYITSYRRPIVDHVDGSQRFAPGKKRGEAGQVRNIFFSNITCRSENGIFIGGEKGRIKNIVFNHVELFINKITEYRGGLYDLRPAEGLGLMNLKTSGFFIDNAKNIQINNCTVNWGKNSMPYFRNAIFANRVKKVSIKKFKGRSAFPGKYEPVEINSFNGISLPELSGIL